MFHIHMYIFRRHDRKFIDKYVNMRGKLTVSDVKGVLQSIRNSSAASQREYQLSSFYFQEFFLYYNQF